LALLFNANNLFGQTNHPAKKHIIGFDVASQKNIEVIANGTFNDQVPFPPEYTNIISNTNLFTLAEQQLLNEARLSVTNHSGSGPTIHHVINKAGDGYDVYDKGFPGNHQEYRFVQLKHGTNDGLYVEMRDDHCRQWLRYSNGMAVDKWLMWNPNQPELILWVRFKEPYNISKYRIK
jgi:hypothetical protein